MSTIPASAIVQVTPSVLDAGGSALDIIGLLLTTSTRVPINQVQEFGNATDVGNYFGLNSTEFALSEIYFDGYDNSFLKPSKILFAQYPTAAVSAYLRSGKFNSLTLAQIQALAVGTITIPINGANISAASVDLSASTSYSDAAARIQAAFTATQATATLNTISGTTLTLGGTITGAWAPGQTVLGVGVTANTHILALLSGTPNTDGATYSLDKSSTVGSGEAMTGGVVPQVSYDSVTGELTFATVLAGANQTIDFAQASTLASAIFLTSATGAVTSQGAAAATPSAFMTGITQVSQDWANFMLCFDPDNGSGNTQKLLFAEWNGLQNNRWGFVCWDTDISASTEDPAPASLGALLAAGNISGTCLIGGDGTNPVTASYAAFVCGYGASLDFTRTNGRTTLAFRSQSGLLATCSTQTAMDNLIANGYNFYGAYATANQNFIFFYPGSVSGEFLWMDSYVDQIWLNNQFQLAFMELLVNTTSIPYNRAGYTLIEAAALDTINEGLNFGAFRAGVTLSQAQAAEVNSQAGVPIANTLNQFGWYFQVLDAPPQVRQERGSPPCTFWYMDGGSVQKINLSSIELV